MLGIFRSLCVTRCDSGVEMRHSTLRNILWTASSAILALSLSTSAAAESVLQKMKRIALEQACRGGDQKSCQDLAKMGGKQPQEQQPGQPPQSPGQQQPGQKPQKPGQASHQTAGQLNDSGPFKPPAGTKIDEKIMAPLQERAQFDVSPHGVHVATTETAGSRAVVYYDGEAGPKFDEIITQPTGTGPHVAFSPDGGRYAYCARAGDQYVVMVDGKELVRSSEAHAGRFDGESCHLGFTSNSKHVFWTSAVLIDTQRGKNFTRLWFDGKPSPTGTAGGVSFSPDGNHYAYILTIEDPYHPDRFALVVDGKIAPYLAGTLQWSGDSKHLYTQQQQHVATENGTVTDLLLDGKPIARAFSFQLYVAPVGDMTVAVAAGGSRSAPMTFLAVNGKRVPGTEIGAPGGFDEVVFSPDGKHYAALCHRTQTKLLIVDGKKQTEYQNIQHVKFTADSSKVVYLAAANNKSFVVLGDQESDAYGFTSVATELLIAPVGNRVGALVSTDNHSPLLYLDGKTIRTELKGISQLRFTSDGTHYAYVAADSGNGTRLAVDGVAQPASSFGPPNMAIYAKYAISPDGKHFAHLGFPPQLTGDDERVLFLDGKYMAINHGMNTSFLTFSPDSKHVAWFQAVPSTYDFRVYIDGKPVVQMEATSGKGINDDTIKWFEFQPDGTLLVLGQDENSLKRISITPSPDTGVATMMGGGTTVASGN
jgi:WD40 repeat protein